MQGVFLFCYGDNHIHFAGGGGECIGYSAGDSLNKGRVKTGHIDIVFTGFQAFQVNVVFSFHTRYDQVIGGRVAAGEIAGVELYKGGVGPAHFADHGYAMMLGKGHDGSVATRAGVFAGPVVFFGIAVIIHGNGIGAAFLFFAGWQQGYACNKHKCGEDFMHKNVLAGLR